MARRTSTRTTVAERSAADEESKDAAPPPSGDALKLLTRTGRKRTASARKAKKTGAEHALRNMSEIRHHFRTSPQPVFFVGATAFNLLGLDRMVRGFSYIVYYDAWQGMHPRVFSPHDKPYIEFESGEHINNWLLRNAEVRAHIARRTPPGLRPQIVMVFFDRETEEICEELGYDLILPSAELRERLDSKIVTTQLGNEVDVPSVPNVLTTVEGWSDVKAAAKKAKLGTDLVIQTAYGDSGKTTYFVTGEEDFAKIAGDLVGVEIKIMKRINNRPIAVEAVITRHGTIVGPFMTEITGHRQLTPYRGGWSGNEMFPDVLDEPTRKTAAGLVERLGNRLGQEGYRGFFEVDVLIDTDTNDVYLGELNPRISGASAVTNVTAGAYADVPLFAFHLLEYSGVDFELDVAEINERWEELASEDEWSTMVIKHTQATVERINSAPPTGRYVVAQNGALVFSHAELDWHLLNNEHEAFYLRVYGPGDYRWKGADLGILVTKGRLQTPRGALTIGATHFIDSIRAMYSVTPLEQRAPARSEQGKAS
ncbi:biotin carboxylase [Microbacterium candidum]|uniref:Biotin carboxylase n=1 Tax=Microbacterium candidum TaxID=3041922 RepID=A0ABT7MV15_9MICO|nr:biotin carboxylase [Microbacterium sp. ASV49]MDL9978289.1 biotin carboxylase [Microbacterium sp. ASV49]